MNDNQNERLQSLKKLAICYYDCQDKELRLRGILGVKKDDTPKKNSRTYDKDLAMIISEQIDDAVEEKEKYAKVIAKEVHQHALWKCFLEGVKGCGECMSAVILTEINIHVATTVSKIWQFAGCNAGTVPGKRYEGKGAKKKLVVTAEMVRGDKPTKGFLLPYNEFLKSKLLGVLAGSFHRSRSPYLIHYQNRRHRTESMNWGNDSKNPTDTSNPKAGHQHKDANRFMIKAFLKDLYVAWRTLEGLSVRPPYQEEYLGYKHGENGLRNAG